MIRIRVAALGAVFFVPAVVAAQAVPVAAPVIAVERVKTVGPGAALPSNTEIWVVANTEINSKKIKQGEKFDLTVARDIMLGDYIVIPHGTPAHGQITYRTGKGAFGKSAKLEFDVVDVLAGDRYVPLSGHYRIEGQGNTGAAVGAVVAVGVFGAFVTGHSAVIPQGTEYKAFTREPLAVALTANAANAASAPVAPAAPVEVSQPAVLTPVAAVAGTSRR